MSAHNVAIELEPVKTERGHRSNPVAKWRGACSCGWTGPAYAGDAGKAKREAQDAARTDAIRHQNDPRGDVEPASSSGRHLRAV